jgi:hypothetical protein
MASFESVHQGRVVGSLAMFDRMIFKGQCATRAHVVSGYADRRTRLMVT